MSLILKANQSREKIGILHPGNISFSLKYEDGKETILVSQDKKECVVNCLNCVNPQCMKYSSSDIRCFSFPELSHEIKDDVCPVDAISVGKRSIVINEKQCIGCGLCITRCPVGAIHIENGKAVLNSGNTNSQMFIVEQDITEDSISKQKKSLKGIQPAYRSGCIRRENDRVLTEVYKCIHRMSQEKQNILARNILINMGCQAALSRQGVVYLRMDGFYENENQMGVLEIETGSDMLAVSRSLLDDIAVVNSRYGITPESNHPMAIVLSLPNKRTDYWQVLKDIKVITNIKICTLTFGALLLFLWNNEDVSNFDQFYIGVDNYSIRSKVEAELQRRVHLSDGILGILENSK